MAQHSMADTPRESLVPIPRNGLRGASGVLLGLMLTLALATVGITLCAVSAASQTARTVAEAVSGVSAVLLIFHTWRIGRRAKGMLPVLVLVAALTAYVTDSLLPAALLIALICGITMGALALSVMTRKQAIWAPLLPIAAYVATLLYSRDLVASAACLLPLPAAWALALGTRRAAARENGPGRVGVICLTSLALTVSFVGMGAVILYRLLGTLDLSALKNALEAARENVIVWVTSAELPAETPDELRALLTRENVELMVNGTVNLLPGYIIALINVLAAVSQLLFQATLVSFGCGASLSDRVRVFRMSAVSCVVFLAAYLLTVIGNGDASTLWGTVAQNIYVILLPGLAFAGLLRLTAGIVRRHMGCFSLLALLLIPLMFLVAPLFLAATEVLGRGWGALSSKLHPPEDTGPTDTPPEDSL